MGRVTIPTDTDAVSETLDLLKRWGADAVRCYVCRSYHCVHAYFPAVSFPV
ncbi:1,3-beta-galactosyl-N-acetylhexosamine phosphorylase N-terminal domain-containing protein [Gemmiger formicilis]|uniref:1,3-beta-galactosyl-N-acetylhexosamine phosphorylase N-terminal domain-containing protein n=1 Tax=Gemmiger formicilis TaxID=745368 RepID=UPI003CE93C3A